MKITQEEFVTVLNGLTEQDLKETQELVENLRDFFGDKSLVDEVDPEKRGALQYLFEDYEDKVCLAVLVSKLSKEI